MGPVGQLLERTWGTKVFVLNAAGHIEAVTGFWNA
jgi:hypothetical protein